MASRFARSNYSLWLFLGYS